MNLVQPGSFLTLHYRLSGPDGADVVNTFDDKPATLSLGTGQLAPAMEQRLIGLAEGVHQTFALAPGFFLIWLAMAAIVVGLIAWLVPITLPLQVGLFAVLSNLSVFAGKRYLARKRWIRVSDLHRKPVKAV